MNWDTQTQTRFSDLRLRDLAGELSASEKAELATMIVWLEQSEIEQLTPAMAQMQSENVAKQAQLRSVQEKNKELAKLQIQLELLVVDARNWLAELERRHSLIQQSYLHLTNAALA